MVSIFETELHQKLKKKINCLRDTRLINAQTCLYLTSIIGIKDRKIFIKINLYDISPYQSMVILVSYIMKRTGLNKQIPDSGLRKMILHMIQLDPDSRCSAQSYLQSYAGVVFPCYFSPFLHKFYSLLNQHNSDSRVRNSL